MNNNNTKPSIPYRCMRALIYTGLVYSRSFGNIFYISMDRLVKEVEHDAEMKRRGSVLKQEQNKSLFQRIFKI